jgi:hypothetical protein
VSAGPEPAAEAFDRAVRRLADRLQVLGPRWSAALASDRAGADVRAAGAEVRDVLARLADAAATAQGQPRRPVPELAPHAWADAVQVLAAEVTDVLRGSDDALRDSPGDEVDVLARLTTVVDDLRRRL